MTVGPNNTVYGTWVEQLEAVATTRELVAVGGVRELPGGVGPTNIHVFPLAFLDGKAEPKTLPVAAGVRALAFASDELLLAGDDSGAITAWDVTGGSKLAELALGASVRALASSTVGAAGAGHTLAAGTADGALHIVPLALVDARPRFGAARRIALSDGAIHAVAWDASGLCVAGGADDQLAIVTPEGAAGAVRKGVARRRRRHSRGRVRWRWPRGGWVRRWLGAAVLPRR